MPKVVLIDNTELSDESWAGLGALQDRLTKYIERECGITIEFGGAQAYYNKQPENARTVEWLRAKFAVVPLVPAEGPVLGSQLSAWEGIELHAWQYQKPRPWNNYTSRWRLTATFGYVAEWVNAHRSHRTTA